MKNIDTKRLTIREIVADDGAFVLDLLNQPSFLKYIGDRGVRTVAEARNFITARYRQGYHDYGFGLYAVELKENQTPIGICGFVRRDTLPEPDLGFAFLPQFGKQGYALEAAQAVMKYGSETLGLQRVLAITTQDNENSCRLLEKLGFRFEQLVRMPHDAAELKLFAFGT